MQQTLIALEIFEKEKLVTFLNKLKEKETISIEATVEKMAEK